MKRIDVCDARVMDDILAHLAQSECVTRRQLVSRISRMPYAARWKPTTVDRRVREALAYIATHRGIPVMFDGTAYRLARTQEDREMAVKQLMREAISLIRRARAIDRHIMAGELHTPDLFGREE